MRLARLVVGTAVVAATSFPNVASAAPTPPKATTSRYMKTTDPRMLYNEGCSQGAAGQNGVVILDFGQPWYNGRTFGTIIFGSNTFRSIAQIEEAAKEFLRGYWSCSPYGPRIVLVVGTSNYRGSTTWSHGKAWAEMVNRIGTWISQPPSFASQESVAGGSDIELDWNTPANSRSWVRGYDTVNVWPMYDYGDAAGCPPYGSCNNGWTQDDVWYVSWGNPAAYAIPEIYTTNGSMAAQWHRVVLYAHTARGQDMTISGVLTQYQACRDSGGCSQTGNTPAQGWSQLWDRLNADARTRQSLAWSTDITWQN